MQNLTDSKQTNIFYLLLISLVSAMGGLLFGYDWVVIGGAKIFYEPFFALGDSTFARGWAMSSALIGCLVGALLSGAWSDKYGRKKMLIIASVLFTISAYGTGATNSFTMFNIFRIIGGLGIGIASNISPIYIAEVSPTAMRGRLVSLNQLAIVLGMLAAQSVNWGIGDMFTDGGEILNSNSQEWAWRYMFWAELIPSGIFLIMSFIIPESPRWLAVNGNVPKAQSIFKKIGGDSFAKESMDALNEVETSEKMDFKALLDPSIRKVLIIGVFLAVFQQWCGINVIFNYAHEIFAAAGYTVSDVLMNIVVTGVTNVIFTFVAIFTVDRWGRRALMFVGSIGLACIYAVMGACYFLGVTGLPMLILTVLAIACYAMSLAPIVWVVLSEIFPVRVRGAAMAVSTFFLWVACFVLTYTFPILNDGLGAAGTFWIYGVICLAGFIFIRKNLPETKGKSLETIEKELASK